MGSEGQGGSKVRACGGEQGEEGGKEVDNSEGG